MFILDGVSREIILRLGKKEKKKEKFKLHYSYRMRKKAVELRKMVSCRVYI